MSDVPASVAGAGGYDDGYQACPCFWGTDPGRLVQQLVSAVDVRGALVLDLGCGEGKNAAYLAANGASVEAWDLSGLALANARIAWPDSDVQWIQRDANCIEGCAEESWDHVIAYGLLHCLSADNVRNVVKGMQSATKIGGLNAVVTFNARLPFPRNAHPHFNPTLLPHSAFEHWYEDWELLTLTDEDLTEAHPHNGIEHTHSMTRLLARKVRSE